MKKLLKERLIKVVKTDVAKFNRYIKFSLSVNIEFSADLSYADLRVADLRAANLRSADLSYADLDMSCLSLSCKSLKFRSDLRIRTQIAFHFASLIKNADQENVTDEEKKIYADILDYVNRFHRTDVAKLEKL